MAKLITHDGHLIDSGTLIYYVNYLGQLVPVIFKKKTKATVTYFAEIEKAKEFIKEGKYKT